MVRSAAAAISFGSRHHLGRPARFAQPTGQIGCGDWRAHVIPLSQVATQRYETVPRFPVLHSFGNDLKTHVVTQLADGTPYGCIRAVANHADDEGLVDLDLVDR